MMTYNFDEVINREGTNAIKWDKSFLQMMFGSDELLPMWVADMDFRCPQPVIDALAERVQHGIFGYSERPAELYDAVIDWNKRRNNWEIKKEWFLYTPGVVPAINYVIQTFTHPGDKVVVQNPVYYPFHNAIKNNGRVIENNGLVYENNRYHMDFEGLKKIVKDPLVKVFILCSPHNPVGRVWSDDELRTIGDICIDAGVLIVSDEIHSDLILGDNHHTVFASLGEKYREHSITCTAPSKTFNLAGLQMSNIIVPNERLRAELKQTLDRCAISLPNTFAITATLAAYRDGEPWLEQLLTYLNGNLNYIASFVESELPGVDLVRPEGTYLAWLDFRKVESDEKKLEAIMQKRSKIALDEGYIFGSGGAGFERINFACPRSLLETALTRMKNAITH